MMRQMFSIGERSGLQAGQFSTRTLLLLSYAVVIAAVYTHTHTSIYIYIYPYIYIALYIVRGISPHPPWVCSIHLGDAGVTLGPFSNVNDRIMLMSDAVSSEGPKTTMFFCNWCWGTLLFTVLHKLLHRLESLCPSLLLRDSASLRHPFYS